jgi:predicted Na+-dependent transporter
MNKGQAFTIFIFSIVFMGMGYMMAGMSLDSNFNYVRYHIVGLCILGYIIVGLLGFCVWIWIDRDKPW